MKYLIRSRSFLSIDMRIQGVKNSDRINSEKGKSDRGSVHRQCNTGLCTECMIKMNKSGLTSSVTLSSVASYFCS